MTNSSPHVVIECGYKGSPRPQLYFLDSQLNPISLSTAGHSVWSHDAGIRLTIEESFVMDRYVCVVSNSYGSDHLEISSELSSTLR